MSRCTESWVSTSCTRLGRLKCVSQSCLLSNRNNRKTRPGSPGMGTTDQRHGLVRPANLYGVGWPSVKCEKCHNISKMSLSSPSSFGFSFPFPPFSFSFPSWILPQHLLITFWITATAFIPVTPSHHLLIYCHKFFFWTNLLCNTPTFHSWVHQLNVVILFPFTRINARWLARVLKNTFISLTTNTNCSK